MPRGSNLSITRSLVSCQPLHLLEAGTTNLSYDSNEEHVPVCLGNLLGTHKQEGRARRPVLLNCVLNCIRGGHSWSDFACSLRDRHCRPHLAGRTVGRSTPFDPY